MSDPRINLPVSKLEDEIERLQTRNERLALLMRLIANRKLQLFSTGEFHIRTVITWEAYECSYTNGIPDLTDEQWERLAKLERGEA